MTRRARILLGALVGLILGLSIVAILFAPSSTPSDPTPAVRVGTCVYDPMGPDGLISTTGGSYYRLAPGESINQPHSYRYEVDGSKCG